LYSSWFTNSISFGPEEGNRIAKSLANLDFASFEREIREHVLSKVSYHNTAKPCPEVFYNGLMLGVFIVSLSSRYDVF
jgi:hypothetical protein